MKSQFEGVVFTPLKKNEDERGWLYELFRTDELAEEHIPAMSYASWTHPGVERGPHEHHDQTDLFCFVGPGDFRLYLWDKAGATREQYLVGHTNPMAVLVPPGVVHAYKNISNEIGLVFNGPNRLYAGPGKRYEIDEIRHEGNPKFKM